VKSATFDYDTLLACGRGELFGPGNAQLPLPPMLMFDRITHIDDGGGRYGKGHIEAELDIHPGLWFFQCHFAGDPVMPGCLGLDALWQLIGFHLAWTGGLGRGRALGGALTEFKGEVTPVARQVTYRIDMKRVIRRGVVLGVADAVLEVDGRPIYQATDLRVGLFRDGIGTAREA
jgi:3-hydroxyacyl-[acyl-carrier protein] dehydratase/trans-2-decenoyl-[acyl-carrier protein] isomerase